MVSSQKFETALSQDFNAFTFPTKFQNKPTFKIAIPVRYDNASLQRILLTRQDQEGKRCIDL